MFQSADFSIVTLEQPVGGFVLPDKAIDDRRLCLRNERFIDLDDVRLDGLPVIREFARDNFAGETFTNESVPIPSVDSGDVT